jgi:hypothetical protein
MGMSVIHSSDDTSSKGILLGGYTQAEGRIEKDDETFWMLYMDAMEMSSGENMLQENPDRKKKGFQT